MKAILVLLAAYAFVAWNDAHAGPNECLQGVRAATEAYRMVVYDAANPPRDALLQALDFRISQQPFPVDREQDKGGMLDIRKAGHTLQGLVELLGAE